MSTSTIPHREEESRRSPHQEQGNDAPQAPGGAAINRAATIATSATLGGAVTGAIAGTLAGPVGTVVGAAVGAVAAGFAGNAVAESIDADTEQSHWRSNYAERPYVPAGASFDDYGPAYRFGVDAYTRNPQTSFEDADSDLSQTWAASRGTSRLEWEDARHAAREAWLRANSIRERDSDARS